MTEEIVRKQQSPPRPSPRGKWRWAAFGALAVMAVGVPALWWSGGSPGAAGQARLVVDRTDVDLGHLRFDTPAAVVGQTTIAPGTSTTLSLEFTMRAGMGGYHEFWVPVRTNDPGNPEQRLVVRSNWIP